jgi:hypothetical protein
MKTTKTFMLVIGLLIGLLAGLVIGLMLANPGPNLAEAAGTNGKVDKYRNVKITEADIELRNELLADEELRTVFINYMSYEYIANVKMAEDISFALATTKNTPGFEPAYPDLLERVEKYNIILGNSRVWILEAIIAVENIDGKDRIALSNVLSNASNALAQVKQANSSVYDLIAEVDRYFNSHSKEAFPELAETGSRLFSNLLTASLLANNRIVLDYLISKIGRFDETLDVVFDSEKLREHVFEDALKTGFTADSERLNIILDAEKLSIVVFDINQLSNHMLQNIESLRLVTQDSEKLGFYTDSEVLRNSLNSETLKEFMDAEMLGLLDSERLLGQLQSFEKLEGIIYEDASRLGAIVLGKEIFLGSF